MSTLWMGIKVAWTTTALVVMEGVLAGLRALDGKEPVRVRTKLLPLESQTHKRL